MNRREKIIISAIELLEEKDISKITTREVVERAGVNISTLHYYYKTKNDLFESALSEIIGKISKTWTDKNISLEEPVAEDLENYILFALEGIYSYPTISKSQIYLYLEGTSIESMSFGFDKTLTSLLEKLTTLSQESIKIKVHLISQVILSLKVSTGLIYSQLGDNYSDKEGRKEYCHRVLKNIVPELWRDK